MTGGPIPTSTEAATADRLAEWVEFVRATEGLSNRHGDLAKEPSDLPSVLRLLATTSPYSETSSAASRR
jgi:hypothetical protein